MLRGKTGQLLRRFLFHRDEFNEMNIKMIDPQDYPHLVEFMSKCLFQDAAPSFREAISSWKLTGVESIQQVRIELTSLLDAGFDEESLAQFAWKYCDYIEGEGARSTLEFIRDVFQDM